MVEWKYFHCRMEYSKIYIGLQWTGKELIRDDITYHQGWENIYCDLDLEKGN